MEEYVGGGFEDIIENGSHDHRREPQEHLHEEISLGVLMVGAKRGRIFV